MADPYIVASVVADLEGFTRHLCGYCGSRQFRFVGLPHRYFGMDYTHVYDYEVVCDACEWSVDLSPLGGLLFQDGTLRALAPDGFPTKRGYPI